MKTILQTGKSLSPFGSLNFCLRNLTFLGRNGLYCILHGSVAGLKKMKERGSGATRKVTEMLKFPRKEGRKMKERKGK